MANSNPENIAPQKAIALLESAVTEQGILASTLDGDNYKRIWSRYSMISGLAGILADNEIVISGLRNSIITLSKYMSAEGFVPSNVDPITGKVSYGSLAGRVDANTWFLIGSGVYLAHTKEDDLFELLKPKISLVFELLNKWEYNNRHLLYTPLSGNWADEYPLHGYLLYDNLLRLWALRIWSVLLNDSSLSEKQNHVQSSIKVNFRPLKNDPPTAIYHPRLHRQLAESTSQYFIAGFNPGRAYELFDAAGNGLALLLGFYDESLSKSLQDFILSVFKNIGEEMIPAFWPPIFPGEDLWLEIENNYSYEFKNYPHHFHNAGIWPVMMGIFSMGLTTSGSKHLSDKIQKTYYKFAEQENWRFSEYISSDQLLAGGMQNLCFSAAGTIFMHQSEKDSILKKLLLRP